MFTVRLILEIVQTLAWLGFVAYAAPRLAQGTWAIAGLLAGLAGAVPATVQVVADVQLRYFHSFAIEQFFFDHPSVSLLLSALLTAAVVLALTALALRTTRALRPDLPPYPPTRPTAYPPTD